MWQGQRGYENSSTPVGVKLPSQPQLLAQGCVPGVAKASSETEMPERDSSGASTSGAQAARSSTHNHNNKIAGKKEASMVSTADPVDIESVICGGSHCAALTRHGTLLTWGLASRCVVLVHALVVICFVALTVVPGPPLFSLASQLRDPFPCPVTFITGQRLFKQIIPGSASRLCTALVVMRLSLIPRSAKVLCGAACFGASRIYIATGSGRSSCKL